MFDLLRFNHDLVTRLQPWLPDEARLSATVESVTIESGDAGSLTIFVSDLFLRAPHEEAAVRAAHQVLDAVQDFLSETMGEPWPPGAGRSRVDARRADGRRARRRDAALVWRRR